MGSLGDCNVTVTHMHTSFIVPKMDDGVPTGEWRLVTGMQSLSIPEAGQTTTTNSGRSL